MAVVGTRYATGILTHQSLGTLLHSGLTGQGWTIQFANADAIGSGTASNPNWNKAPVAAASAGLVIYQMPAFGVLTRWFVSIELVWRASGANARNYRITVGTGQVGGVLTNPGTTYHPNDGGYDLGSGDCWLSFWEHGFLIGLNDSTNNYYHYSGLERRRDFFGNVQDDCVMYVLNGNPGSIGMGLVSNTCDNIVRNISTGERTLQPLGVILGQSSNNPIVARSITTFNQPSGNVGFPMGFYTTSGGLGGTLRLAQLWWAGDSISLSPQDVFVDGATRQYWGTSTSPFSPNGQRILLAQN